MTDRHPPVKMVAFVDNLSGAQAKTHAKNAVKLAQAKMPRVWSARKRIDPVYGNGHFGISWEDPYLWYQERGIKAFTMNSLRGKVIPMWVADEDHKLRTQNPRIQTQIRSDGSVRVLIFRRATNPGAPGRINVRRGNTPGYNAGWIAPGNVGVKWRHPGMDPKHFFQDALREEASRARLSIAELCAVYDDERREWIT